MLTMHSPPIVIRQQCRRLHCRRLHYCRRLPPVDVGPEEGRRRRRRRTGGRACSGAGRARRRRGRGRGREQWVVLQSQSRKSDTDTNKSPVALCCACACACGLGLVLRTGLFNSESGWRLECALRAAWHRDKSSEQDHARWSVPTPLHLLAALVAPVVLLLFCGRVLARAQLTCLAASCYTRTARGRSPALLLVKSV